MNDDLADEIVNMLLLYNYIDYTDMLHCQRLIVDILDNKLDKEKE